MNRPKNRRDFLIGGAAGAAGAGRLWVDCALTHYWYQDQVGFDHVPLPSLDARQRTVLRENPS